MENLNEFLARQLNDHEDSARGVVQPTHFTWHKNHIENAINLAFAFLYSLIPEEFSEIKTLEVDTKDCLVSFCDECKKFMSVIDIQIGDTTCIKLTEESDEETNALGDLLSIECKREGSDENIVNDEYSWSMIDSTNCVIQFSEEIPVGAKIRYTCAKVPDIGMIDDPEMKEYMPIIAEFAMWWLYRTDSESRSNLLRAELHFSSLKWLVENKLKTEFSIREDDYIYTRRKVDD